MDFLLNPKIWMSFLTLAVLEVVLGIDNIIFLSIVSTKLPRKQQKFARTIGLGFALALRILLLSSVVWLTHLTDALFSVNGHDVSWRDLIMLSGGMFLLFKGTTEIHYEVDPRDADDAGKKNVPGLFQTIIQIGLLDLVFSLDSVITAIGMAEHLGVMIAAVVFAIAVMLFAAETVGRFIEENPSIKMLALSFILLVGMALVADGMHVHIEKAYLYFAIGFSLSVETLNILSSKARRRRSEKSMAAVASDPGASQD